MTTPAVRRLTESHRLAQLKLGQLTVAQLLLLWPLLDVTDVDGTFDRWLAAMLAVITNQRRASAQLAGTYLTVARTLELGVDTTPFSPLLAADVPVDAVKTSLLVTGPVRIKQAIARGLPLAYATETARASSASAGMRHVLNGGRATVTDTVRADVRSVGWERVTSGLACDFCLMLASRGAVYREDTVDFEAHDHCACAAAPIYRR